MRRRKQIPSGVAIDQRHASSCGRQAICSVATEKRELIGHGRAWSGFHRLPTAEAAIPSSNRSAAFLPERPGPAQPEKKAKRGHLLDP